jgi:3-phosphoshikimate 1-carboxyvinyltransferase
VLSLADGDIRIEGQGTLLTRPNRQVIDVLRSWGCDVAGQGPDHRLPIRIRGTGALRGGRGVVDGSVTSQVVSALLMAAPFAREKTVLVLRRRLVSRPYVDVTLDVLRWAGIRVTRDGYRRFEVEPGQRFRPHAVFTVPGDYSSAAFLLAAAALTESDVTVTGLTDNAQGDRRILSLLSAMGVPLRRRGDAVRIRGPCRLRGVDIDGSDIPDLVPILTVLGCFADGCTRIRRVRHLAFKESNRLTGPAEELGRMGARIRPLRDGLVIRTSRLVPARVSPHRDHRLAMALAVAALGAGIRLAIPDAECIAKSYPGFVADMRRLGADVRTRRK